jgi:hypothetical protein
MESSWATRKCPGGGQATSKGEVAQPFSIFFLKKKKKEQIFLFYLFIFLLYFVFFYCNGNMSASY